MSSPEWPKQRWIKALFGSCRNWRSADIIIDTVGMAPMMFRGEMWAVR